MPHDQLQPHGAAFVASMSLRLEHTTTAFRGPGHFAKGTPGQHATRTRKPLNLRLAEEYVSSRLQPGWLMDQIYVLLTIVHTLLQPFAAIRVTRAPRSIMNGGRFVQDHTRNTLTIFKRLAPELFSRTNTSPQVFPVGVVRQAISELLAAAVRQPGKQQISFRWPNFSLTPYEVEDVGRDALHTFMMAMTLSIGP